MNLHTAWDGTEKVAMDKALLYERSRGWEALDVSLEDRGFDILSRNPVSGDVRLSCTAWMGASCKDKPLSCGCRYNITARDER